MEDDVMSSLQGRAHGEKYIDEDDTLQYPLGFAQVGLGRSQNQLDLGRGMQTKEKYFFPNTAIGFSSVSSWAGVQDYVTQ